MSRLFKAALISLLLAGLLNFTTPTHAATTAIGGFYAGCSNFNVDVALTANENDGNNVDKLRFRVTDGNNNTLYIEDFQLQVGQYQASQVFNLRYNTAAPAKNPIRFALVNLNAAGQDVGEVGWVNYNAPCLAAVGSTTRNGVYNPNAPIKATLPTNIPLYDSPNGTRIVPTGNAGSVFQAVYRTVDATWVALFVGGNDLVWVPTSSVSVDVWKTTVPPSRILGSGYATNQNSPTVQTPTGGVGTAVTYSGQLRLRDAASTRSNTITKIPPKSTVAIIGRNAARTWLKVSYNGQVGWVSVGYVRISSANVRALPVVQ
jgi:uncharacterized protein YgiM (DUF1202 family)